MYSLKQISFFRTTAVLLLAVVTLTATPVSALVSQESELTLTTRGMVSYASFTLSTPCSPYILDWGDGEVEKVEFEENVFCVQMLEDVELRHEYQTPGDYTISFRSGSRESFQLATVPAVVRTFGLDEVKSVSSVYVDPSELIADEEYSLYTITLVDGYVVTVKAGGYTTKEWTEKQFVEAGYTGEVEELTALAVQKDVEEPEPETEITTKIELQKKIVAILKQLIELLGLR